MSLQTVLLFKQFIAFKYAVIKQGQLAIQDHIFTSAPTLTILTHNFVTCYTANSNILSPCTRSDMKGAC